MIRILKPADPARLAAAQGLDQPATPTTPADHIDCCVAVAAFLAQDGFPTAFADHTGGGIWCVLVPEPAYAATDPAACWTFGTANDTWGGDLTPDDGSAQQILDTPIRSSSRSPRVIAWAIAYALRVWRWERAHPDSASASEQEG